MDKMLNSCAQEIRSGSTQVEKPLFGLKSEQLGIVMTLNRGFVQIQGKGFKTWASIVTEGSMTTMVMWRC